MIKTDFTTDIIFKEVLKKNLDLCKELIQRCIPELEIGDLEVIETEKELVVSDRTIRIRLDVMVSDRERQYNLEMMKGNRPIEKLIRYGHSMIDVNLEIGSNIDELSEVVVLYLCTYDPFGYGLPRYTLRNRITELPYVEYNDGSLTVVVTSKGIEDAPSELKPLIQLSQHNPGKDQFSRRILGEVGKIQQDPRVRKEIMEYEIWENLIRKEGISIGEKRGIAAGKKQGRDDVFAMLLDKGKMSPEEIEELRKELEKDKES